MGGQTHSGMSAADLPGVRWWKSTYSNPSGNCVEVARLGDGRAALRNSRFPDGAVLVYPAVGLRAFLAGVKAGRLGDFRG